MRQPLNSILPFKLDPALHNPDNEKALAAYVNRIERNGFLPIIDCNHFSQSVGYKLDVLYGISNSPQHFYRGFKIKKRNGSERNIFEPLPALKEIQYWLLDNLFSCAKTSRAARAYKKGFSVKGNALVHRGQRYLIKLDFKNFFESISSFQIFNFLYHVGYSEQICGILVGLVTYDGGLPQGAPTSPMLSNIVMFEFDERMLKWCKEHNLRYTRYADDISISGNAIEFSEVIRTVRKQAHDFGCVLNETKTKVMTPGKRKVVTGLTVNDRVTAPRAYRRKIRQEIYYIKSVGLEGHLNNANIIKRNYLDHLIGKVNFVLSAEDSNEFRAYRNFLLKIKASR